MDIRKIILFLAVLAFLLGCTNSDKSDDLSFNPPVNYDTSIVETTIQQQEAFDALNALQLESKGHLYSTFVNIDHPCFPPDSSFVITQNELLKSIQELLEIHSSLSLDEQKRLSELAVLAQEKYTVFRCTSSALNQEELKLGIKATKMKTTWVLPNVLGIRDVVLTW
jgi:hypothetical protein